jgi:hypothetical protein
MLRKIISGGQTGADRAGLDFAIEAGLEYGGFYRPNHCADRPWLRGSPLGRNPAPKIGAPAMAKLVKIAETKDLTSGQAAAFDVEGQKIALYNVEGTFYAIGDTCTHRGGP